MEVMEGRAVEIMVMSIAATKTQAQREDIIIATWNLGLVTF